MKKLDWGEDRILFSEAGGSTTAGQLSALRSDFAARIDDAATTGSRIGILLPNEPRFLAAVHAIWSTGRSAVLLNPANSPRELAEQIADSELDLVITRRQLGERLSGDVRVIRAEDASSGPGSDDGGVEVSPGDEAIVIFTSAMEGRAKGAILTHGNLRANAAATAEAMELVAADRISATLPFCHAFGLTVSLNAAVHTGATILSIERFNPIAVFDQIERLGTTVLIGVPAVYSALLAVAEKKGAPEHTLRVALCGGAPLPLEIARRWEESFGLPLRQGYGLTEASPVCLFNRPSRPNRIGTLGYPIPGVEVTIRSPAGRELPDGEVGEICVRGENVFQGYIGDPSPSNLKDRELRTGDLGTRRDGVVRFQGIVKRMFTKNGFNIYPEEIRRVLEEDQRIQRATVFARPDRARENEIVIEVLATKAATLKEEDVLGLCRAQLAAYKQPGEVRISMEK